MRLRVELTRERFRPGEEVSGSVRILEAGRPRTLEVALAFRERSPEFEATARSVAGGDLGGGDLPAGFSRSFSIRLPDDALPNYLSEHGELWWEVEARAGRVRDSRRIEVVSEHAGTSSGAEV